MVAGLTQAALAERAGVSRQLVSAVEAGRNLPRVDAALALAGALGVSVADLFSPPGVATDVISGEPPAAGSTVQVGSVAGRPVTAPLDDATAGDGTVSESGLQVFEPLRSGLVAAGCDPALGVLAAMLRERGMAALATSCGNRAAMEALAAGRAHAALLHGPTSPAVPTGLRVDRIALTAWEVGLAGAADAPTGWWRRALDGAAPVAQREPGTGAQDALLRAMGGRAPTGPTMAGHTAAARYAALTGTAAVTIAPAALAAGASFHPLERHVVELWVDRRHAADPAVTTALDVVSGARFRATLGAIGGYELDPAA